MAKRPAHKPMALFTDAMPAVSGNTINGLGEKQTRRASPFFWHPPEKQTHGELQKLVTDYQHKSPEVSQHFSPTAPGGRGPRPIAKAEQMVEASDQEFSRQIKSFALANEADVVGIARMSPEFVYEGYTIEQPWVVLVGVAMQYEALSQAPPSFGNPTAAVEVAKEYNRASRACRTLSNHILSKGYSAKAWPGPYASALNMLPAAIAAGLGELGKHGSLINRELGSRFRLSAITTDMPLVSDSPDDFGIEDYCSRCQACTNACPPAAISNDKQWVRGIEKWYVDFDKCIPYFGETLGCAVCIVTCPWSRPGVANKLLHKHKKP